MNLYEEKGLLRPNKNSNGYRLYGEEEIKTLKQIKILRSLDFSLSEIKDIIINNEYCFFDNKLSELKIRDYDLQKKIQYLDLVKNDFIQNEIIENIEEYRELLIRESKEEIKDKNIYVDFEKILIVVFTFFTTISICGRGRISGEIIIIIYLLILICRLYCIIRNRVNFFINCIKSCKNIRGKINDLVNYYKYRVDCRSIRFLKNISYEEIFDPSI